MDSVNMKSLISVMVGVCMLILFSFVFNNVHAQPMSAGNVTPGAITEPPTTPTTPTPATASTTNVTIDNSANDSLNIVDQTTNSTFRPGTVSDLKQTQVQIIPQNHSQVNQTSPSISAESRGFQLNERLLNYTNDAILGLNDDNDTRIQQNLVQIQDALIKAIGKPVVIIPAPAFEPNSDSE